MIDETANAAAPKIRRLSVAFSITILRLAVTNQKIEKLALGKNVFSFQQVNIIKLFFNYKTDLHEYTNDVALKL